VHDRCGCALGFGWEVVAGDLGEEGVHEAADTVWVTNSPEVYVLLTVDRGWSPARYERWLAETWGRLLLQEPTLAID
jgi:hypothetical protein